MPSAAQLTAIQSALAAINPAIPLVLATIKQTQDPTGALQLTQLASQLTNVQTALTEAQIALDDAVFTADTAKLNALATVLKKQQASMAAVLKAVDSAGKIAGYLVKVLGFIAKL